MRKSKQTAEGKQTTHLIQVKLQNKMLDNQNAIQRQRGEDGAKMSDAQRLALDGK